MQTIRNRRMNFIKSCVISFAVFLIISIDSIKGFNVNREERNVPGISLHRLKRQDMEGSNGGIDSILSNLRASGATVPPEAPPPPPPDDSNMGILSGIIGPSGIIAALPGILPIVGGILPGVIGTKGTILQGVQPGLRNILGSLGIKVDTNNPRHKPK